ncbi:unnamed protein product [Dovyalis caffra]|uniref:Uncharacterized protein n=1 Tax=Dovyalis caffra TaxID=77055 RepID=A0AAV1RU32_9ROSI|nr:unnamed protein product [Dovyalis caffra]
MNSELAFEVAEDGGTYNPDYSKRHHLSSNQRRTYKIIRSQAKEPQQIIQNQEMWLEEATASLEGDGGCATEDSFDNEISFINIGPALQVEMKINRYMLLAIFNNDHVLEIISVENDDIEPLDQSEAVLDGYDDMS